VKAGKEMEAIMWSAAPSGTRTWKPSATRTASRPFPVQADAAGLEKVTQSIRAEWLKTAPPEGKKIYADFLKKVGR